MVTRYKAQFNRKLQIASLNSLSSWEHISVHNLMQNYRQKQPSINAYLGARYSRSSDSVAKIAQEIVENKVDAASRLESIFQGYGHKSVGDMAEVFVCIENVPMITAMRAFNINPTLAGQERSTRFQNFQNPNYIGIPKKLKVKKEVEDSYHRIMQKFVSNYSTLLPLVQERLSKHFKIDEENKSELSALKARAFDSARYLLPLGLNTSLGFIMSARNWSEYISRLRGSRYIVEQRLGDHLYSLLIGTEELKRLGYTPEADGLIRHTLANSSRGETTEQVLRYLEGLKLEFENAETTTDISDSVKVSSKLSPEVAILSHYLSMLSPNIDITKVKGNKVDWKYISEIIFKNHHHNNQIGNIGQTGAYRITGYADHGVLKDLNRHRSMERFVPMWEDIYEMGKEFNRDIDNLFAIPDYLNLKGFEDIKETYTKMMRNSYREIIEWSMVARNNVSNEFSNEYTRYLLPHAHTTRYIYYGSLDDLQYTVNLRVRPGGHIAYRKVVYSWLKELYRSSKIWSSIYNSIPSIDVNSREQFIDRS